MPDENWMGNKILYLLSQAGIVAGAVGFKIGVRVCYEVIRR